MVPLTTTDPDPGLMSHLVAVVQSPTERGAPSEGALVSVRQVPVRPDWMVTPEKRFWIGEAAMKGKRAKRATVALSIVSTGFGFVCL